MKNLKQLILAGISLIMLSNTVPSYAQDKIKNVPRDTSESRYEWQFNTNIKSARLKLNLPLGFKAMKMKDVDYGEWNCGVHQSKGPFQRVFINIDSGIVIAMQINSYDLNGGRKEGQNTNWKHGAQKSSNYFADTSKEAPLNYEKNYLDSVWGTDFGVQYTRKCKLLYLNKYTDHRVVALADKDRVVGIVFFFTEKSRKIVEGYLKTAPEMLAPIDL